jgi:hypothetical protein
MNVPATRSAAHDQGPSMPIFLCPFCLPCSREREPFGRLGALSLSNGRVDPPPLTYARGHNSTKPKPGGQECPRSGSDQCRAHGRDARAKSTHRLQARPFRAASDGARALLPAVFLPGPKCRTEVWRARMPALRFGPMPKPRAGRPCHINPSPASRLLHPEFSFTKLGYAGGARCPQRAQSVLSLPAVAGSSRSI